MKLFKYFPFLIGNLLFAKIASAHEAYVLPRAMFWEGIKTPFSFHAFDAMKSPANVRVTAIIVVSVLVALLLNFFYRRSKFGRWSHSLLDRYAHLGPHFVRLAIGIAFIFSAVTGSFLGPELQLSAFAIPSLIQLALFAIGVMILVGFFTEFAALLGIVIFLSSFAVYGPYVLTYLNYLGELVVLFLFGMRVFSIDKVIFGPLRRFETFERYETLIVRVLYGTALVYAAITVKLLHPELTLDVINTWNLTQFHWLFPSDPLLVTFGAGIVESVIGLFIIFGFEMRLTIWVSLFYITLSLIYFREMVWPHLLLYGLSFNLLVQPETFTIDHILFERHRKVRSWWRRPLSPHNKTGKSSR